MLCVPSLASHAASGICNALIPHHLPTRLVLLSPPPQLTTNKPDLSDFLPCTPLVVVHSLVFFTLPLILLGLVSSIGSSRYGTFKAGLCSEFISGYINHVSSAHHLQASLPHPRFVGKHLRSFHTNKMNTQSSPVADHKSGQHTRGTQLETQQASNKVPLTEANLNAMEQEHNANVGRHSVRFGKAQFSVTILVGCHVC